MRHLRHFPRSPVPVEVPSDSGSSPLDVPGNPAPPPLDALAGPGGSGADRADRRSWGILCALGAVLALLVTASGCATLQSVADWWATLPPATDRATPPGPVEPPVTPPGPVAGEPYIVRAGERIMKPATSLSFTALMGRDGSAQNEDVILFACADERCDTWMGGNSDTFSVRVNSYNAERWKMKVYGKNGKFCGEPTVDQPWRAGVAAKVKFEILPGKVRLTVNDARPIEQPCATPDKPTIGVGWPPSVRQGALGSVLTGLRWSEL